MWLSIALAVLTYLLSDTDTASDRRNALLKAAAVGGATYAVTENTDWGKDISNRFDGAIGVGNKGDATGSSSTNIKAPGAVGAGSTSSGSGLWSTVSGWGAAATGFVAGTVTSSEGSINWPLIIGLGIGAYLILKD